MLYSKGSFCNAIGKNLYVLGNNLESNFGHCRVILGHVCCGAESHMPAASNNHWHMWMSHYRSFTADNPFILHHLKDSFFNALFICLVASPEMLINLVAINPIMYIQHVNQLSEGNWYCSFCYFTVTLFQRFGPFVLKKWAAGWKFIPMHS